MLILLFCGAKVVKKMQICKFCAGKENLFLMCGTVMARVKVLNSAFIVRLLSVYCAWIVRVLCVIDRVKSSEDKKADK